MSELNNFRDRMSSLARATSASLCWVAACFWCRAICSRSFALSAPSAAAAVNHFRASVLRLSTLVDLRMLALVLALLGIGSTGLHVLFY